jgi:hypothetical protein
MHEDARFVTTTNSGPIQQRVKKKKENDRGFSGFSGSDRFDRCDRGVICDMT